MGQAQAKKKGGKMIPFSPKEKATIKKMHKAKATTRSIAEAIKRSESGVYYFIRKHILKDMPKTKNKKQGDTGTPKKETSELADALMNIRGVDTSAGEEISLHHKEMLIEILHKVIV